MLLVFAQAVYLLRDVPTALTGVLFRAHEVVQGWTFRTRALALAHYCALLHGAETVDLALLLVLFCTEQRPMGRLYLLLCFRNLLLVLLTPGTLGKDPESLIVFLSLFIEIHGL